MQLFLQRHFGKIDDTLVNPSVCSKKNDALCPHYTDFNKLRQGSWSSYSTKIIFSLFCLLSTSLPILKLEALPSLDNVSHGQLDVINNGNELILQAQDQTIANFRNFDINTHEVVRFEFADPSHSILNRITSDTPSQIDGKLFSNGIVYLENPAGVIFGPTSIVDVAALYAIAGHLSNEDFIQKIHRFSEIGGKIEVHGTLTGQEIALIGQTILQKGSVLAKGGNIIYATNDYIYLGKEDGHLFIKSEREILNNLEMNDHVCFLESGSSEAFLLFHSGVTKAKQINLYGNEGSLSQVSGIIDASTHCTSEHGGQINIQAEVIDLKDAYLESSGPAGGGTILIGKGLENYNFDSTANYVSCDENSQIYSNATTIGNGGKIVLWAERGMLFDGKICAQGGSQGGDGGFVETSSHLRFSGSKGRVCTLSPKGQIGQWILDPFSIQVGNQPYGSVTLAQLANTMDTGVYLVDPMLLATATTSITLAAVQPVGGPSSQNIQVGYFNAPGSPPPTPVSIINPTSGVSITFDAMSTSPASTGSLNIIGTVEFDGDITIDANTTLLGDATITSRNGAITFNGFVTCSPPGSYALTLSAKNDILFNQNVGDGAFKTFNIQNARNITFSTQATIGGDSIGPGIVNLTKDFSVTNGLFLSGNLQVTTQQGNIIFNNLVQCQPSLAPSSSLYLSASQTPNQTINFNSPSATVTIAGDATASGNILFAGPVVISEQMAITSNNGSINFNNTVQSNPNTSYPITLSSALDMTFSQNVGSAPFSNFTITQASKASFLQQAKLSGSIHTNGDVTFTGTVFPSGNLSITSDTGGISFNSQTSAITGVSGLPLPADLTLSAANDITLQGPVGTPPLGNILVQATNNFSFLAPPSLDVNMQMTCTSLTITHARGNVLFQGLISTSGRVSELTPIVNNPTNGGDVFVKADGDINFYYLENRDPGVATPILSLNDAISADPKRVYRNAVILTTAGRSINPGNGFSGGNVTLTGRTVNVLGINSSASGAFPDTYPSGSPVQGGRGGDVTITSTSGTIIRGFVYAKGGSGPSGGTQVLPSVVYTGQNLDVLSTIDRPGNITFNGPVTLGFNGVILRGGDITVNGAINSENPGYLLTLDGSKASSIALNGPLSNLSYFVVANGRSVEVNGTVQAEAIELFNCGNGGINFNKLVSVGSDPNVADGAANIITLGNSFTVAFEDGVQPSIDLSTFHNCGGVIIVPPSPGESEGSSQIPFSGSYSPPQFGGNPFYLDLYSPNAQLFCQYDLYFQIPQFQVTLFTEEPQKIKNSVK